ncbi:MAG TPA: SEC59/DGK1/VTE5 family protein [Methanomassiliicoccales archaeon]|nr:SEC59/DGK1/VTE5 family protein [Methanomassiliicoccales archaeon]
MDGDLLGLLITYSYIGAVVVIASKWSLLREKRMHRKFIHLMIGNIVIFWWIFDTSWVMAFLAAAPFIPILILLSKEGSRKDEPEHKVERDIKHSILAEASVDGHKLGLVYYAISWTILAFLSFDNLMVASIGIVCMAYGDGMGGLIGKKFGRHKIHGGKSIEGTAAVFSFASLACMAVFIYSQYLYSAGIYGGHGIDLLFAIPLSLCLGLYVAIVELYTPGEYDNLVIPLSTALILTLIGV